MTTPPVSLEVAGLAVTDADKRRRGLVDRVASDARARAEIDSLYLNAGVISPAEIRTREGWTGPAPTRPVPVPAVEVPA